MTGWGWAVLAWAGLSAPVAVVVGRAIRRGHDGEICGSCGHGRQAHEHYRAGTDCALCDCRQFLRGRTARLPRSAAPPGRTGGPLPRRRAG
jgi:hypothetical protein